MADLDKTHIIASTSESTSSKNEIKDHQLPKSVRKNSQSPKNESKNYQIIKPNKKRQKLKKRQMPLEDQLHEDVCRVLRNCTEGTELQALTYALQPESEFMECIFDKILIDVHRVLKPRFQNYEIHPFGSSVCGMAFKCSDFDIYVDLKELKDKSKKIVSKTIYQTIDSMRRMSAFEQTVAIVNAKIPLLKCVHTKTGFSCDFSFTSPMGRYNSQIIRQIIYFDHRIHPLVLILKHWMRTRNLLGTGKITSYCLIMMVIFYLQTVRIIKPLFVYQTQIPKFIVDKFWNLAWNTSYITKPHVNPDLTISHLLQGFIDYYKNFDFDKHIICPLYGHTYERSTFASKIPLEFETYIEYMKSEEASPLNLNYPMCVQDPFALNHNVASSCRSLFRFFHLELCHASEILKKNLTPRVKSAEILYKFFTEFAVDVESIRETNASKSSEFQIRLLPIEFELSVIRSVMKENNETTPIEPNQVKKRWVTLTTALIQFIFKELFKLRVTPIVMNDNTNERLRKYQRLTGQKDVSDSLDVVHFNLSGTEDVYHMKKLTKTTSPTYFIDEATYATSKLEQLSASKKHSIELSCVVSISSSLVDVHVVFNESGQSKKSATKCLYQNFTRSVRNHLKAYFLYCQRVSFVEPDKLLDSVEKELKSKGVGSDVVKTVEELKIDSVGSHAKKPDEEIKIDCVRSDVKKAYEEKDDKKFK